ncbi:MAG TPA: DUF192 domain-containing protein [Candidatus Paceibacterota bacterium]|nr:DUF192 domain-containing protein [Candidatus Paceibacterota bacterium]
MRALAFAALALLCLIGLAVAYRTGAGSRASFGGVSLTLEYATTTAERELGLGGRADIPSNYGMLFVFPDDERWGIWMKSMRVPLDLFWLDDDRRVVWIEREVATDTYPDVFYPPVPARYVLETAAGFAATHQVASGTPLFLPATPNAASHRGGV